MGGQEPLFSGLVSVSGKVHLGNLRLQSFMSFIYTLRGVYACLVLSIRMCNFSERVYFAYSPV